MPLEDKGMKLTEVSYERIKTAGVSDLYGLSVIGGIQDDEHLVHSEDLRERLILMKRKMEGSSNTWKPLFQSVKEETKIKSESLMELLKTVETTFQMCHVNSLSEILKKEGHLQNRDLLQELSKRIKSLSEQRSLVIIAGETNGGKSTFLNLLLGEDILPTDILHCTFAVCKIVYSDTYSIKTLDHDNQVEHFPQTSRDEVKEILRRKVSQSEMKERVNGSPVKEITLGLPADILKSGVTLVDTPGIGEDENMDNVTMNFVKSTHASAFIYIIKSDTAGGVQEDRLLGFLRAIKERYSADTEVEAFDPRAAMFVCHRWDNIEEQQREKVKMNALSKLEYVWPGFEPSQTYFFSTKETMKHLPVDPEFVTDSFMLLLKGLKQLFERASHNAIKHQYLWLKYMLQPASRHLKSMITHCIHSNEELEMYFKNVAQKQNTLMLSSMENSKKLQHELNTLSMELKEKVAGDLNFDHISACSEIHECEEIIATCSKENFLYNKANRRLLDEMIIRILLKYVDDHIHERKLVTDMEARMLTCIQEHLGLFRSQISYIKHAMQNGGHFPLNSQSSRTSLDVEDIGHHFRSSTASMNSAGSNSSSIDAFNDERNLDTSQLAFTINSLLLKRKNGKSRRSTNSKHEFQESLLSKVKSKIKHGILHKTEPAAYVDERIRKVAKDIREDKEVLDNIVTGYTEWIQQCVNYATNSIPKFIEVNSQLMDEIREHRYIFQMNKDNLRKAMEDLEPSRHYLRGYGLLYMDDINAEMLAFNVEQRNSSVFVPSDLVAQHKPNDDSGFEGSGSKKRKVQSLWARMQGATIQIDNMAERVVVKTYIYDMDEKDVLSEIASLRCLDHTSLASFLGMTRIVATGSTRGKTAGIENLTEKVSAFIFKGNLVSAHVYSARKMTNMQLFIPDFIHSLLQGLNYIHRENLVHMELNLDTVMVERVTGTVKLCQMCKPREARFPASLSTITRSCVCLSPNVLQGHEYESTDDMYAFGLLLWELLFPDEPPFKVQRTWPLKRFIEQCQPVSMLQESLMKLNVSENVREVLRGTLLVSRRTICLPIATVQSLLADLSEEPAIGTMKPKLKPFVYRRKSPGYNSGLELVITETSGRQRHVPIDTVSTEETPQRPPRKKDNKPQASISTEEPEINIEQNWFISNRGRRQTEPAIVPYTPNSPSLKSKNTLTRIIAGMFGRSSKMRSDVDHSDDNESFHVTNKERKLSVVRDDTDSKKQASPSFDNSTPKLKPTCVSQNAKKQLSVETRIHSRRFSLQDQSLFGPRSVSLKREESFDVPSLMTKYSTNKGNISPRADSPRDSFLASSRSDSLLMSNWSTKSVDAEFHGKRHLPFNKITSLRTGSSTHKSRDGSILLKSRTRRDRVPENVSQHDPKLLGQRLGSSLQDLSRSLISYPGPKIGPIIEDTLEAAVYQPGQNRNVLGHPLGGSLQNVSDERRVIGPIMEDKVDTSNFQYGLVECNNNDQCLTNSLFKRSLGNHRWSYSAVSRQHGKYVSSSTASDESAAENSLNTSSNLAYNSSTPSLKSNNGSSTDFSGIGTKDTLEPSNGYNVNSSDLQICSSFLDNALDKQNSNGFIPFRFNSDETTPSDSFRQKPTDDDNESWLALTDISTNSDVSEAQAVYNGNSVNRTVHFSFSGETNSSFDSFNEEDIHSQRTDVSNDMFIPPPPPLNFLKLSFGKEDYSDDEEC